MRAAFVIEFASLIIFGAHATMIVVISAVLARAFADSQRPRKYVPVLIDLVTISAAIQAAGYAHRTIDGALGYSTWPFVSLPM